jgi:hypothetical protein
MRKALLVSSADYGICTGPANGRRSVRPAAWGMQRRRCASRCRGLRRAVSGWQTYAAATRRRGACSLRPLARLVCVCCRGPSPKLQLEWAQMACVAFFRMIEGCDPEQYAVLDLDIIGAARFQVPH